MFIEWRKAWEWNFADFWNSDPHCINNILSPCVYWLPLSQVAKGRQVRPHCSYFLAVSFSVRAMAQFPVLAVILHLMAGGETGHTWWECVCFHFNIFLILLVYDESLYLIHSWFCRIIMTNIDTRLCWLYKTCIDRYIMIPPRASTKTNMLRLCQSAHSPIKWNLGWMATTLPRTSPLYRMHSSCMRNRSVNTNEHEPQHSYRMLFLVPSR